MIVQTHFHKPFDPAAAPGAVVQTEYARFTVLKSQLIRMEYSPEGRFEDRPSQPFWYRRQPVPHYTSHDEGSRLVIETADLRLVYDRQPGPFTRDSLQVEVKGLARVYQYGDENPGNLLGTTRTLDETRGAIQLEPGLNSRSGWVMVDDSQSLVFDESGWLQPRQAPPGQLDLYFFGYGHEYLRCILEYQDISGNAPLLPRWVLGNWWSRYWAYRDTDLKSLMLEFKDRRIPLSVCIVDMDWHVTETGNASSGWTGYTWNRELFPDPPGFIDWLHKQGLRTSLNLHPALGVWPHEEPYEEMAHALGVDPQTQQPLDFDIATPQFAKAYFEVLHHPLEAMGIDFWWMDWQQGKDSKVHGLDPLWWLNHLHFYDLGRDGKRPFVFSRWGGLGNHRYPIGFSGDTQVTWDVLAYQPFFTSTAANVGYGWWSHDIGGHYFGVEDRQLYTRWVQFGVFSPIFRLHCTNDPYLERRPWGYDEQVLHIARQFMQLRHAMIPYIYTLSWRNESKGVPPVLPMYYAYPEAEEAYNAQHQYLYGGDLLCAPVTSPLEPDTNRAKQAVWLPDGDWFHFFSGEHYPGGTWHSYFARLEEAPVFARAGAIIPLAGGEDVFGTNPPENLDILIFPGMSNRFELFEDDGNTTRYREKEYRLTPITQEWGVNRLLFSVLPAEGQAGAGPQMRSLNLFFKGIVNPQQVRVTLDGKGLDVDPLYLGSTLELRGIRAGVQQKLEVTLETQSATLIDRSDRRLATIKHFLRDFRMPTFAKIKIERALPEILLDVRKLAQFAPVLTKVQMQTLVELVTGVGSIRLTQSGNRDRIILWNDYQDPAFRFRQAVNVESWWTPDSFAEGPVPPFKAILPEEEFPSERMNWRITLDYFGLVDVIFDTVIRQPRQG